MVQLFQAVFWKESLSGRFLSSLLSETVRSFTSMFSHSLSRPTPCYQFGSSLRWIHAHTETSAGLSELSVTRVPAGGSPAPFPGYLSLPGQRGSLSARLLLQWCTYHTGGWHQLRPTSYKGTIYLQLQVTLLLWYQVNLITSPKASYNRPCAWPSLLRNWAYGNTWVKVLKKQFLPSLMEYHCYWYS